MADGILKLSPAEARAKAQEMKKIADEMQTLLEDVSKRMEEVDNVETGMYQGDNRPAQLRAELDEFRSIFNNAYEQITKSSNDIIAIANVSEAQ
ncbi:MAG: hypothetical protein ACI4XM_05020 [Candidatus Coprovivens sp.]